MSALRRKFFREIRDEPRGAVARDVGISRNTLWEWERRGRTPNPSTLRLVWYYLERRNVPDVTENDKG